METNKCHLCQNEETIAHIYQCPHRHQWRSTFENELIQQLQSMNLSPTDQAAVQTYVHELLNDSTTYQHFHHFKIFGGLIPRSWGNTTLTKKGLSNHSSWQFKMSRWFTQQGHSLWLRRNEQNSSQEAPTSLQQRQQKQIEKLYTLQDEVPYLDKAIFETPIEERLKLSEKQKQIWIDETTKTVQASMAEHTEKMSTGQTDIRQYYKSGKTQ